jgi:cyclohexanone monooxygenase
MKHPAATPTVDMLIIGAGFAGLCMLHKARCLGLDARVLEASPSVGGTW